MTEWKDIATAPKDGTDILVCEGSVRMTVVSWIDGSKFLYPEPEWVAGWYLDDGKNEPIWCRNHLHLTDWMPLPPPPGDQS